MTVERWRWCWCWCWYWCWWCGEMAVVLVLVLVLVLCVITDGSSSTDLALLLCCPLLRSKSGHHSPPPPPTPSWCPLLQPPPPPCGVRFYVTAGTTLRFATTTWDHPSAPLGARGSVGPREACVETRKRKPIGVCGARTELSGSLSQRRRRLSHPPSAGAARARDVRSFVRWGGGGVGSSSSFRGQAHTKHKAGRLDGMFEVAQLRRRAETSQVVLRFLFLFLFYFICVCVLFYSVSFCFVLVRVLFDAPPELIGSLAPSVFVGL